MTENKENKNPQRITPEDIEIDHIVDNLYIALTGEEPSSELSDRFEAGGNVLNALFLLDKNAGYVALASLLQETSNRLPENAYGKMTLTNLADYFQGKAGYKIIEY